MAWQIFKNVGRKYFSPKSTGLEKTSHSMGNFFIDCLLQEIGLIFNTTRTATVESTTPMDLLVIGKEDFNAIFMKAEDHDEEAEHVKFLR